jgi:sugar lactone lactonase YvrE
MDQATIANNGVQHPNEGDCLAINLTAATQGNLDCSSLVGGGEMLTIYNRTGQDLGYKFSPSATPNIAITGTSGPTACSIIPANGSARGYVPRAAPNLHLISVPGGYVHVHKSTVFR